MHVSRQGPYQNSLYLPLNFVVNLKLLFKKKQVFLKHSNGYHVSINHHAVKLDSWYPVCFSPKRNTFQTSLIL